MIISISCHSVGTAAKKGRFAEVYRTPKSDILGRCNKMHRTVTKCGVLSWWVKELPYP